MFIVNVSKNMIIRLLYDWFWTDGLKLGARVRYDKIEINHEKIAQLELASRARRINIFFKCMYMPPAVNALARMRICTGST